MGSTTNIALTISSFICGSFLPRETLGIRLYCLHRRDSTTYLSTVGRLISWGSYFVSYKILRLLYPGAYPKSSGLDCNHGLSLDIIIQQPGSFRLHRYFFDKCTGCTPTVQRPAGLTFFGNEGGKIISGLWSGVKFFLPEDQEIDRKRGRTKSRKETSL